MNIGLYFGSYNPIHTGHLIIAGHVAAHCSIDQVWFVVSPHNPLKESKSLLNEYDRLHLVKLAIAEDPRFKASDIEFHLPRPSYTIDTLTYLSEKFPQHLFSVIMGGDSFQNISQWKNYQQLLDNYALIIYRRPGYNVEHRLPAKDLQFTDAPMLDISATFIRNELKAGRSIRYLVPDTVAQYIKENRYYL
jgi:nicotinate-nucleotide adenylyltransferase